MVDKDSIQRIKTSDTSSRTYHQFSKKAMHLFTEHFKSYSKEEHLENVFKLVDHLCRKADVSNDRGSNEFVADHISSEDSVRFGLFTDQLTALKMLDVKAKSAGMENKDKASFIQLMACNIKPLLINAAENKSLTDFLVAASPSVSFQFWYEMCEKYAIQLVEEEQYVKASMYFLLCGKLYDAVNILSEKGRILEALALAKARLPETDPKLEGLFRKAAKHFSLLPLIEVEASCYLALKDPLQAAKVLYCGADAKYIFAAAYICAKFEMKEEAEAYAYFCMERCLSQCDWATFYRLIEHLENFKVFKALVRVHELISKHLKELKKEDGLVANDVFGIKESRVQLWSGKVEDNKMSFLAHLFETLISENIILSEDQGSLQSIHEALNSMDEKRKKFEVSAEAHVCIAICATQVILTALLGDFNLATKYFQKIFTLSSNIVFVPKVVCWLFLPLDVYYCSDTGTFDCDIKNQDPALPVGDHFLNILKTVCNKVACMDRSVPEDLVISENVLPHLETFVPQVITVLSEKSIEDGLLLYFFYNYLNELKRVTKKGWKFRCYEKVMTSNDKDTVSGGENSCVICETESSVMKPEVSSSSKDIEELIQTVLKEAEEKAQIIMQSVSEIEKLTGVNNNQTADALEKSSDPSQCCDSNNESGMNLPEDVVGSEKIYVTNGETCHDENPKIMEEHSTPEKLVNNGSLENGSDLCESFEKSQVGIGERPEDNCTSTVAEYHVQCWSDVSLCYTLTKSLISIICRDEYALLYYLQKYLHSIDNAIAALARKSSPEQKALNLSKAVDKLSVSGKCCQIDLKNNGYMDNQEQKSEDLTNNRTLEETLNINKNVNISSEDSNSLQAIHDFNTNCNQVDFSETGAFEKNQEIITKDVKNSSVEEKENVLVNTSSNSSSLLDINKPDVLIKNGDSEIIGEVKENKLKGIITKENNSMEEKENMLVNTSLNSSSLPDNNEPDVLIKNGDSETVEEVEKNKLKENSFMEARENVVVTISLNSSSLPDTNKPDVLIKNEDSETVEDVEENTLNSHIGILNGIANLGDEIMVENGKDKSNLIPKTSTNDADVTGFAFSKNIQDTNSSSPNNKFSPNTDSIVLKQKLVTAEELRNEQERICEQIKLLKSKEFHHPCPLDAATNIINICCEIFRKNPCKVVQEKFHAVAHQVTQWKNKFSCEDKPLVCEICQQNIECLT